KVDAAHVFPMAGPPMFLREALFRYNGTGLENDSIFTDQREFLAHMKELRPDQQGHLFLPGTEVEVQGSDVTVTQTLFTDAEIDRIFGDKW
ncbi:hypothetical protein ABTK20_20500, partial [Acinetobacter baumannii]